MNRRTDRAPHDSSHESVHNTNTSCSCPPRLHGQRGCRVPRPLFEKTGEVGKLPSVDFLVPRRTPVPRIAVLILANVTEVANHYLLYAFFDTPLNDVLAEGVEEVVFAPGFSTNRSGSRRTSGSERSNPFHGYRLRKSVLIRQRLLRCSRFIIDDVGKGNVFLHLIDLDGRLLARPAARNDQDVASLNFRDPIALVADCFNRYLTNLSFVNWLLGGTATAGRLRASRT
jgi:hypothetical protein